MPNFDFVSDEKFRFSLEKDYQELTLSLQNGAWKAAYILAGSIVEAILIDYFLAAGYQEADLLERRSSNGELTRREKAWFAQEK